MFHRLLLALLTLLLLPSCSPSAPSDTPAPSKTNRKPQPAPTTQQPAPPDAGPAKSPAARAPSDRPAPQPASAKPAAYSIAGLVRLEGTPPKRLMISMTQDQKCAALHGANERLNEDVLVADDGAIQNAFVYVRSRLRGSYPVPTDPAVLDQKGCMYTPRIQGIRVGQTLRITNSDPLTHNIRSFSTRDQPFNIGQIGPGTRDKVFTAAEPAVKFKCDIHPWMTAYIFLMDHPFFATTDAAGRFAIRDLPPGEYRLAAWHEVFGQKEMTLHLADRDPPAVNFTFTVGTK